MNFSDKQLSEIIQQLVGQHSEEQRQRIETGVRQAAQRWRESDGDFPAFAEFCGQHFVSDSALLDEVFTRFQRNLESLMGNLHKAYRQFNWPLHVDTGDLLKVDQLFANFDMFAHVVSDMFATKLAFVALLNFPLETLENKSRDGENWSRRKWAEIRLAELFADRVPGEVKQKHTTAYTAAEEYVYHYNIYAGNLRDADGKPLFPETLKLISHWGLRDEIKGQYANPDGLEKQELLHTVMERIIAQEIPRQVVDNPKVVWHPHSNALFDPHGKQLDAAPEANARYETLLKTFHAEQLIDPYTPDTPSLIDRRFQQNREILEDEVEAVLIEVLSAPVLKNIAQLISQRLKRDLQPFDIWYTGLKSGGDIREDELDELVSKRYPNVDAFQKKMDGVLESLGFTASRAKYLQNYIAVDASRGAGHALGAKMRWDKAHLRTRVPRGGMDYKGFNTAMHELGHTVEQVFTLNDIDFYTLEGVPNTAFTEAFAFVFQGRDLDVLGKTAASAKNDTAVLHELWQTAEIAGVSLLDMRIWRWLYANPGADAAALKTAVIELATNIWNEFFAPNFGVKDSPLLAIYSHIFYCGMYIPDYAIGHIIAYQINHFLRDKNLAIEMERMCKLGRIAPQVWIRQAVGEAVSAKPMIADAETAIAALKQQTNA
ncbi:MAG: hypothetical protein KDH95_19995 [Calditrichaeota bacterium]|nr:hypothetical protein [Calditrichota bacterium]